MVKWFSNSSRSEAECQLRDQPPTVPTTVDGWQLFHEMKGNGLAAIALTRAARKVVKIGLADRRAAIRYAEWRGWI